MQIHLAHTEPLNPAGAEPKLTQAQVWEGIKIKARDPLRFVPVIESCEVVEENAAGLTRKVRFKDNGAMPNGGDVTEVVKFNAPTRADFHMLGVDNFISNIISTGEGESDLYLTFTFTLNFPDIEEGTEAATEKRRQVEASNTGKGAVQLSVKEIRALAKEGKLGA